MVTDTPNHYPVLLNEIISIITPQHGGTFIDCTFGQGGYSKEILKYNNTKIIALDRDVKSKVKAEEILNKYHNRFFFENRRFSELNNLKLKYENIKGIIFDLGFSYSQIKDPSKGLSFNFDGKLNMKMGLNDFSAHDVINNLDSKDLEKIFKIFGEEREAKKIALSIERERKLRKIDTKNLIRIIEKSKFKKYGKLHNATKIFQALRMFVNKEISELINGLVFATKILKKDGVLAVVTFHSIEDKIVKYFFKSLSEKQSVSRYMPKLKQPENLFEVKKKKPIFPSKKEIEENISSRSAKLRYAIKKKNFYQLETDLKQKFDYLIQVEKLGDKL